MTSRPRRLTEVDRRLALRLLQVRGFRGLSRAQLCRMLGWHGNTLFSIEVGRAEVAGQPRRLQPVTVGEFAELCYVLEVPPMAMLSSAPLDLMALPEWGPR